MSYLDTSGRDVLFEEVTQVLDALDGSRVRHWVGGGWGGHGRQGWLDGAHFDHPPGAFTVGALNGRQINCLSVQQQRDFHTGYEHQAKDTHDLAQLKALD
jgi:hypothetical protein